MFDVCVRVAEQDLYNYFSPYGPLISTRIMMDKMTGRNKGYGMALSEKQE